MTLTVILAVLIRKLIRKNGEKLGILERYVQVSVIGALMADFITQAPVDHGGDAFQRLNNFVMRPTMVSGVIESQLPLTGLRFFLGQE